MRSKQKGRKKYFISVLLVLTCLLIILAAVNHKRILHLYHAVTLFETSRLNGNFRNLDQRFPSIKVAAGDDLFLFEENMRDLPDTYNYFGENRSVNDFIEKTDTTGFLITQDNKILYEAYFNGYSASDRMITWSLSKPIISALIGIAIEDGSISSVN